MPFALPPADAGRLDSVLPVLYLIFNEGYASTAGTQLLRADLADEAIRMARILHAILPEDSGVSGLLALMLLVHARHRARTGADGSLIPMAEQDRALWDRTAIQEGAALITTALPRGPTGPYHSRPRSPRSTTKPAAQRRRTGPRSRPCTKYCSG